MFSYCDPSESWDELERILQIEQQIIGGLELPYRVVNIAAGDLGPAAAKKYDIEAWLPSEGQYRELTSCSNYTDYSARRLGTRMKGERGNELVHTLNGTACAVSRTLVFLFEHYQDADGGFTVPEVLRPFDRLRPSSPRRRRKTGSLRTRRDAGAAERDGLENRWVMSPVGSNPTPSATLAVLRTLSLFTTPVGQSGRAVRRRGGGRSSHLRRARRRSRRHRVLRAPA